MSRRTWARFLAALTHTGPGYEPPAPARIETADGHVLALYGRTDHGAAPTVAFLALAYQWRCEADQLHDPIVAGVLRLCAEQLDQRAREVTW